MIEKVRKSPAVVLMVLLFLAACASASVTTSEQALAAVGSEVGFNVELQSDLSSFSGYWDYRLTEIGEELSEPTSLFINSSGAKSLPAIPAAFMMVLAGFVSFSLVRDRKIWQKVTFGVFYYGFAGVNCLPGLIVSAVKIKQFRSNYGFAAQIKDFARCISSTEDTRYVGLLRRVGLPDDDSFAVKNWEGTSLHQNSSGVLRHFLRNLKSRTYSYYSVITSVLTVVIKNFTSTGQMVCLVAGITSSRVILPRGKRVNFNFSRGF